MSRLIVQAGKGGVPDAGPALDAKRPQDNQRCASFGEIRASERDWEVTKGTTSLSELGQSLANGVIRVTSAFPLIATK